MKLILMRHAEALPASNDFNRKLSAKGKADMKKIASILHASKWALDEIRSSPFERAVETKENLLFHLKGFGTNLEIQIEKCKDINDERLRSGSDVYSMLSILHEYTYQKCVLWILHAPTIAELASKLTGMPIYNFSFEPGSLVVLNLPLTNFLNQAVMIGHYQPDLIPEV